jgi:hypothetical protein
VVLLGACGWFVMSNELVFQNLLVPSPDISIFRSISFLQKWRVVMICDARGRWLEDLGLICGGLGLRATVPTVLQ